MEPDRPGEAKSLTGEAAKNYEQKPPARLRGEMKKIRPDGPMIRGKSDHETPTKKTHIVDDGASRLRSPGSASTEAFSARVGERQRSETKKEKHESEVLGVEQKYEYPRTKEMLVKAGELKKVDAKDGIPHNSYEIAQRLDRLRVEGHGPQRHLDPTNEQLLARLGTPRLDVKGAPLLSQSGCVKAKDYIDPMTGTTTDGVTGNKHFCGPVASAFLYPADYVTAEFSLRSLAEKSGLPVIRSGIDEVLGKGASERMRGYSHDKIYAGHYDEVDFTGGSLLAVFERNEQGKLIHKTMMVSPREED